MLVSAGASGGESNAYQNERPATWISRDPRPPLGGGGAGVGGRAAAGFSLAAGASFVCRRLVVDAGDLLFGDHELAERRLQRDLGVVGRDQSAVHDVTIREVDDLGRRESGDEHRPDESQTHKCRLSHDSVHPRSVFSGVRSL